MFRKLFLLIILIAVSAFGLLYKSPIGSDYYYKKGKAAYEVKDYQTAILYFEKSVFANPVNTPARYSYVLALSEVKPVYSVQKKLYEIATSSFEDEAQRYAQRQCLILRRELLKNLENNYISSAESGGDIIRWDINSFPLKIYWKNIDDVPDYYPQNIEKAFNLWSSRTNFLSFEYTKNEKDANIVIKFSAVPADACTENICKYTIAYTEPVISTRNILKRMDLTFYMTNPYGQKYSPLQVYNSAIHEIGHTLGIMGHSENPNDAMYATDVTSNSVYSQYRSEYQSLSNADIQTLVLLYRLEPSISNKSGLKSENFYYPPLILGDETERLMKKIEEYEKYLKQYPNFASSYINLASVYSQIGDNEKALELFSYGEQFAKGKDDKYLIKYNTAIVYYNMKNYSKALDYAFSAKNIKSTVEIDEFISEVNKLIN